MGSKPTDSKFKKGKHLPIANFSEEMEFWESFAENLNREMPEKWIERLQDIYIDLQLMGSRTWVVVGLKNVAGSIKTITNLYIFSLELMKISRLKFDQKILFIFSFMSYSFSTE